MDRIACLWRVPWWACGEEGRRWTISRTNGDGGLEYENIEVN
jgi:hypothetical protein